jgi:hypothetical protein
VDRRIVTVEEPLLLNHHRPLLLEMLQELVQDHHGVAGVDGDDPGTLGMMRVYTSPVLLKNISIICFERLAPTLALTGPGRLFLIHCYTYLLVCVVWKDTVVSSIIKMLSNIDIELWFTEVTKSVQILTCSFFCSSLRSLVDPSRRLLYKHQLFMQDDVHGAIRNPMGSTQIHAGHPVVNRHIGGTAATMSRVRFVFIIWYNYEKNYNKSVLLTIAFFTGLNFLEDVIDSSFCQGLVPKSGISEVFDFVSAFSGPGKARNKISPLHHCDSWQRYQRVTVSQRRYRSSSLSEKKTSSILGSAHTLLRCRPALRQLLANKTKFKFDIDPTPYFIFLCALQLYLFKWSAMQQIPQEEENHILEY